MTIHHELEAFAEILSCLAKHNHRSVSPKSILSGLPVRKNDLDLYIKSGKRAGFELRRGKYELEELDEALLPTILMLDGGFALLLEIDSSLKKYKISYADCEPKWVSKDEIQAKFLQDIFLVKPLPSPEVQREYFPDNKHWFWSSLRFSRSIYLDVFIATFLLNIFALLTPLFVRNVYDRVVPNAAFDTLAILASGMIVIYLFDFLFKFFRTYLLELAGKKSDIIISSKLFEHVLNLKLSHKFKSVGAFANNIKEFDTLRNFLSSATLTMLVDLPFSLLFLFVVYIMAGKIMLVPLIGGAIIIFYGLAIARPLKKHIDETSKLSSWKSGVLIESLGALETIKSFGLNSMMQWKWEESVGEIADTSMKSKVLTTSMSTLSNFIVQISNIIVIILGVYAIHEKTLTMGGLIAVTMLTSRALTPLAQISSLIINYEYAKSSYEILNKIYKTPIESDPHKTYIDKGDFEGHIEFKNVSFTYPDTEYPTLNNVSFSLSPGESVALLGSNGSGKTTLLKLIMGFYEPASGMVLIDGIDTRHINPAHLREKLNYLPQEVILFGGTIQENILYSRPRSTAEALLESVKKSNLNNFIESNPMGYNFPVGERGNSLSGGQKQLIGLSRVFLREECPILLLDEPTNALDMQTEAAITKNLETLIEKKTTLIVSHKINMLHLAPRAIVLNQGKIIYDGPSDTILNNKEVTIENNTSAQE